MDIRLHYGLEGLTVRLPDAWEVEVVRKRPMPVLPDPAEALEHALKQPLGAPALARQAQGCRTACILVCDATRPAPNGLLLPALIRTLSEAGIEAGRITILVATGLHRPNLGEELRRLIGVEGLLETVAVVNHEARRDEDHVLVGRTSRGTPVLLDRRFVEADLRIATGLVEPHFMAGYSGGRKVVTPGVAHAETITRLHTARFLEDERAAAGVLAGNPLHQELLDALDLIGPVTAVNVVLDEERRPCFINYGEIVASHAAAAGFMKAFAEIPIRRPFATVIATGAGHPLDATYYQTVKGMVSALGALKEGGGLFIASACSEGMGSAAYVQAQKRLVRLGPERFLSSLLGKERAEVDEWQTEMQLRAMRAGRVHLFTTGLSEMEKGLTGVQVVASLEAAVREWVDRAGDRRVAVIPEGPYVVPMPA